MFSIFTDPVKMAQQMEIILNNYGFAIWETLYALALEVLFAYAIGLPLGVLLVTGEKDGIRPMPPVVMKALNIVINLLRSVPFLILMIIALPLSKIIVGTKVGTEATIPPMVVAAFPLVARMVESSLREVGHGVIEAAQSMGASPMQIIWKVLLPAV
jgi:D-methionine transport system permease protein